MKTLNKVSTIATWLPGFNGFYGSIWEDDSGEEMEIENINSIRGEKGLSPITWDECEWDYSEFYKSVAEEIAGTIGHYLASNGFISGYEFEKLQSPREYNFMNDSIHIKIKLSDENRKKVSDYLRENKTDFEKYIKDHYTSRSGFISHYSDDVDVWLNDDYATHAHKLGAVLDFILNDRLEKEDGEKSVDFWLFEHIENRYIFAKNHQALTSN
jgi:hypothetical protein